MLPQLPGPLRDPHKAFGAHPGATPVLPEGPGLLGGPEAGGLGDPYLGGAASVQNASLAACRPPMDQRPVARGGHTLGTATSLGHVWGESKVPSHPGVGGGLPAPEVGFPEAQGSLCPLPHHVTHTGHGAGWVLVAWPQHPLCQHETWGAPLLGPCPSSVGFRAWLPGWDKPHALCCECRLGPWSRA